MIKQLKNAFRLEIPDDMVKSGDTVNYQKTCAVDCTADRVDRGTVLGTEYRHHRDGNHAEDNSDEMSYAIGPFLTFGSMELLQTMPEPVDSFLFMSKHYGREQFSRN